MKRSKSHQIDEKAMQVFRKSLPLSWVLKPQHPDYAKDYLVEIAEGDDLTGVTFIVQLKGEESPKYRNDATEITFYLKKKYAIYYADKVKEPVFLVVVDASREVGYWTFIQS